MDLVAAIDGAVQSVRVTAETKNIRIGVETGGQPVIVDGDPSRVDQILGNLLSNALKFTPAGGRITLRLERGEHEVRLVVADTGVGIAPEVLPHVFDRFRQADSSTTRVHGGLGLGLALVRYLVEAHGGVVHAESPGVGGGATFVVTLPIRAGATAARAASAAVGAARLSDASVLIVDDDADTREVLAYALRAAGVKVTAVGSASDALAALTPESSALVVSDLSMPGEDGYALVRQLRERDGGRRRPAIALTAHARADDRRRALAAGFDAYLVKPVDAKDLVALMARLLYT